MSDASRSATFYAEFQSQRAAIAARLKTASSSTVQQDIARLRKSFVDAYDFLAPYDQGQCESQLRALEQELDERKAKAAPKPKFSFKKRETSSSGISTPQKSQPAPPAPTPSVSTVASTSNISLSNYTDAYLTSSALPQAALEDTTHLDITISDIQSSIVNLATSSLQLGALHIRGVHRSLLLAPVVRGSILINDCSDCVLVIGCHQFRMHTSKNVDVYLHVGSLPVIEHSQRIRFAPYTLPLPEGVSQETSKHYSVQDFDWIRSTPSPNWSRLPEEDIRRTWPTEGVASNGVARVLEDSLPPSEASV
ncbi:hypothetical protein BOTBODRAFT_38636 [Botryobasidium botryosum FD-172 SS1]|uniref:C-CAP/cofactor C-like domain-containing protein n=1 Tax=Botryobasidium botryosum (strain FD-172 SS1) TaxID=930990 RepID=A0A067LZ59_BOTB1|nr:hypothetical protein BOTBODRAFT_38636 [Botryobasidium botryosum FD-172 SS1]